MPFNFGDIPLILQELRRYFASKAQGTLADSALQPGAIGSTVQAYHARLDSLSGITNADGGIEKTGANTYGRYALTAFGKSLVDDADASTARSTLGLTIGSNVQAWDADLDALAAISTSGPIERTGPGTWGINANLNGVAGVTGTGFLERTGTNTWGVTYAPTFSSLNGGPLAGSRNRIINGSMVVDQRNATAGIVVNNAVLYTCDRWQGRAFGGAGTGAATIQRITDAPPGFSHSLRYTVTNAKTADSADGFGVNQPIEGANIIDFAFNTTFAKTVTLSFWVKSSLTGTFSGHLRASSSNPPNTPGSGNTSFRSYIFTYTISTANTWEYKTITIPGDTNAGFQINTDTREGLSVLFDLGSGSSFRTNTIGSWQTGDFYGSNTSVQLISTLNATWQITGVQLELGTTATPIENRLVGHETALCQRYYQQIDGEYRFDMYANTQNDNVTVGGMWYFFVSMRALPTVTILSETSISTSAVTGINVKSQHGVNLIWGLLNTNSITPRTKAVIIAAEAEM